MPGSGVSVEGEDAPVVAAERRGVRDHALVALALGTILREAELAALGDTDVPITARTGKVRVLRTLAIAVGRHSWNLQNIQFGAEQSHA